MEGQDTERNRYHEGESSCKFSIGLLQPHVMKLIFEQPNVMPVLEFQLLPSPSVVMPYYPDGHLGQHVGRLSDQQFVSALRQILVGLSHLHGRRIIHRDLKPENLLVNLDVAKNKLTLDIADFGLSKTLAPTNDLSKTFCGTLLYAAPDIFPGMTDAGYRANMDIWGAGVIIFGCMWGLPEAPATPWRKDALRQATALKKWISTWTKSLLEKMYEEDENNDQVIKILCHMVDPNPETRYSADRCLEAGCRNGLFEKTAAGDFKERDDQNRTTSDKAQAEADHPPAATDSSRPELRSRTSPHLSGASTKKASMKAENL
jgi:serine/threonine protein kinase